MDKQTIKVSLPIDKAQKEIDKWLEYKKVSEREQEGAKDQIKELVEAVSDGNLIINEDFTLLQPLRFPLTNSDGIETVKELKFKARMNDRMRQPFMKGVKADDVFGYITATVAALTGEVKGIIDKLDTQDSKIARSIATFFL